MNQFVMGFKRRKFSAGLLVAFIDLFLELDIPNTNARDFASITKLFPRQTETAGGKPLNTIVLAKPGGGTISLRPFYDAAERYYRAEEKRFDYPSCAPHATQAWPDYISWLDALATYDAQGLYALKDEVNKFVLDSLKSQAFDPASVRSDPPLFKMLLEGFDMSTAGRSEPSGASYQGLVFGFLRADNPHLQIEIEKVRVGSKRLQRVGDIDGWEGDRLAISAEVKQMKATTDLVSNLEGFANETGRRGAIGLLVALTFATDSRKQIEDLGLRPLDLEDLVRIVDLWDPLKQRTAVASFVYYATHVEKNSSLSGRIENFLKIAQEGEIGNEAPQPQ